MASTSVVETARRSLGPVGAYLPIPFTGAPPIDQQRGAVRRLERAGYAAAWTNETVGGKDPMVQLALLLAATERLTFGTGIANIWARAPQTAHAAAAQLSQAYPGRLVLGLGTGYPQQAAAVGREFARPLASMRDYLKRMAAPTMTPAPAAPYPRIIAANGQKMMALAGELADGAAIRSSRSPRWPTTSSARSSPTGTPTRSRPRSPRTWQPARTTSYSCPPAPSTAT
jgi:alkanesulfonate monooxygenase SsuD/methylene tetrahydromethanopterin reductase-like flavin-dependent oxidoreductase (luciferase family)